MIRNLNIIVVGITCLAMLAGLHQTLSPGSIVKPDDRHAGISESDFQFAPGQARSTAPATRQAQT